MYQRWKKNFITFIDFNLKSKSSLINNTIIEKFVVLSFELFKLLKCIE